jgi:hypothetical protein
MSSSVRRSELRFEVLAKQLVELRSTGRPKAAVPTWPVVAFAQVSALAPTSGFSQLGETLGLRVGRSSGEFLFG